MRIDDHGIRRNPYLQLIENHCSNTACSSKYSENAAGPARNITRLAEAAAGSLLQLVGVHGECWHGHAAFADASQHVT